MKKQFVIFGMMLIISSIILCGCEDINDFNEMENEKSVLSANEVKAHPYGYLNVTITIRGRYYNLYAGGENDPTIDYLKLDIPEPINNSIILIHQGAYSVTGILRISDQEPFIGVLGLEPIYTDAYKEGELLSFDEVISYPNQYLNEKILIEGYYELQIGSIDSLRFYYPYHLKGQWIRLKYEEGVNLSILIEDAQYRMEGTLLYEPHSRYGHVSYLMVSDIKPV